MTLANIETGEVAANPNLWLDQAVGHHVAGDLNADEALAVTARIKAYAGATWVLIAAAHERKAHKALGYKSWGDYVQAEFDISRSRSYQLISQAKVVLEIAEVSTMVDISEREARDLEPVLDEAKAAASEAIEDLPDEASEDEKAGAVLAAMDGVRKAMTDRQRKEREKANAPKFPPTTAGKEGAGAGRSAAPSEPDAETIARAVERATDPALTYRVNVDKALGKAHDLVQIDVEKAIATAGESATGHRHLVQSIHRWCDRYLKEVGRPDHLRSVK